jgi:hypothetical protein
LTINDNFYISEKGIGFFYNEYDIAPYVMGPTEVLVPYEAIKPYIRPDGPLGWVF